MRTSNRNWTVLVLAWALLGPGLPPSLAQEPAPAARQEPVSPVAQVRSELRDMRSAKATSDELAEKAPVWLAQLFAVADAASATPDQRFEALTLAVDVSLLTADPAALEQRKRAIERLLSEFCDDVVRMTALLRGRGAVEGLRAGVFERTKKGGVKAYCLYQEAVTLSGKLRSEKLTAEEEQRMYALFERVRSEFGSEKDELGRLWKDVAGGSLAALRDLAVGKLAPEIEGRDLDGVPFKLSDYRGKVVVIDFWGNW